MYFKLFKLHSRAKRSVAQPQTIYSEFPFHSRKENRICPANDI